jgi:hypothetical protein
MYGHNCPVAQTLQTKSNEPANTIACALNLKGLSSEIGWAESGIIRRISFKGKGAEICNWF